MGQSWESKRFHGIVRSAADLDLQLVIHVVLG